MDYIPLSNGTVAVVDDCDYDYLCRFKWSLTDTGYPQARVDGKPVRMHQLIMGKQDGKEIDHINRVKVDNRRENLRFVTHQDNCYNRPRYGAGCDYDKRRDKWRARISINSKVKWLGYFASPDEATIAYQKALAEIDNKN
jgi:hypothetical protein